MRVYLAGPDVFLPEPQLRADRLKAICAAHGLCGVSPLDPWPSEPATWSELPEALRIARCNEAHIGSCDALIANLTPFRGPSADPGTVFELGFMRALGRPVFGWTNSGARFAARTRAFTGAAGERDADGLLIEDFPDMTENLMIDAAIVASGGTLEVDPCPPAERWLRLDAFGRCVSALGRVPAQRRA